VSVGRGAVSLAIGLLGGIFLSAFVAMIAESAGTPVRSEWLVLIVLIVTVGGAIPTHHFFWRGISGRQSARSPEDVVTAPGRESEV
jgi:hypothetical protein